MSQRQPDDGREDWVDVVTRWAAAVGLNPIRVRWKLEAQRKRWRITRHRADEQAQHVRYEHKICPSCGRLNDRTAKRCVKCEEELGGRWWHVLHRLGLSLPEMLSVSSLIGVALVVVYGRILLDAGDGEGILSLDVETLIRFGGNYAPFVFAGEHFRLGTCIFLHAGLWHLGFNLIALSQVGPQVEEIFGRGRMLLIFMVTGLVASLGSLLWEPALGLLTTGAFLPSGRGVSIGASGAVLGLIGLAAGWGHRDGTTIGKGVRGQMLKWCLYTLGFGFFIGADNVAHVVGFLSGGALGFVLSPRNLKGRRRLWLEVVQVVVGGALALACMVMAMTPHRTIASASSRGAPRLLHDLEEGGELDGPETWRLCQLLRAGRVEEAIGGLHPLVREAVGQGQERRYLEAQCQAWDQWRVNCRLIREQGFAAFVEELRGEGGEQWRELGEEELRQIEETWRGVCAELNPRGIDEAPPAIP